MIVTKVIVISERESDYCLTPNELFISYNHCQEEQVTFDEMMITF